MAAAPVVVAVAAAPPVPAIAPTASAKKSPSDFLKLVIGRPVIVKLNSGTTYHGNLYCKNLICF